MGKNQSAQRHEAAETPATGSITDITKGQDFIDFQNGAEGFCVGFYECTQNGEDGAVDAYNVQTIKGNFDKALYFIREGNWFPVVEETKFVNAQLSTRYKIKLEPVTSVPAMNYFRCDKFVNEGDHDLLDFRFKGSLSKFLGDIARTELGRSVTEQNDKDNEELENVIGNYKILKWGKLYKKYKGVSDSGKPILLERSNGYWYQVCKGGSTKPVGVAINVADGKITTKDIFCGIESDSYRLEALREDPTRSALLDYELPPRMGGLSGRLNNMISARPNVKESRPSEGKKLMIKGEEGPINRARTESVSSVRSTASEI